MGVPPYPPSNVAMIFDKFNAETTIVNIGPGVRGDGQRWTRGTQHWTRGKGACGQYRIQWKVISLLRHSNARAAETSPNISARTGEGWGAARSRDHPPPPHCYCVTDPIQRNVASLFRHTGSTKHPKTDPAHRLPKTIFIFIHFSKNALSLINFPRSQHFVFIHFRKNASNNIAGRPRSQQRSPRRGQRPPDPPFSFLCGKGPPPKNRTVNGTQH